MKSTVGNNVTLSLFGASHGPCVGAVIGGLAPGILIDTDFIRLQMDKRRPKGKISTSRHEEDEVALDSGIFEGRTTGTPVCLRIANQNVRSGDYAALKDVPRPSHADYTAQVKYGGFQDYRGGGHFSGRLTAALVAAGAIFQQILEQKGIGVATHIAHCHGVWDVPFAEDQLERQIAVLQSAEFPTLDGQCGERMRKEIEEASARKDSVGGVLETVVCGMPAGVGEPYFFSVESVLSHLLFSVGGVKGVEFGAGFAMAEKYGSEMSDALCYDGAIKTKTNHNGGINGGITNGMPIRLRTAVKPTPSIAAEQESVNLNTKESVALSIAGRHDPAIVHRACAIVDAVVALGLLDLLVERYGIQWMAE